MKIITIAALIAFSITASAQIPASGLIGHYPFSGNANDISGSANNGTVFGATLTFDRFGSPNSAYHFDGSTSYISTLFGGPMGQSSRSISFWAKTNSSANMMAIAYGDANGNGGCFDAEYNLSCSGVGIDVSNGADMRGNNSVHDNQWHNIIIIMDSTLSTTIDNISIYIDGVLQPGITCSVLNSSATVSTVANNPFVIGKDFTSVRYFDGDIDDILVYNRPLTTTEVSQIFNATPTMSGCADISTGLIAHYDFTGNANDLSGNGNNGTVYGANLAADRFGNANSAYTFNGTSDYIEVPHSSSLTFPNNRISISFWVKFTAFVGPGYKEILICKQDSSFGSSQMGFNVYQMENTSGGLLVNNGTTSGGTGTSFTALGSFHHIVHIYNSSSAYTYLDGTLMSSQPGPLTYVIGANTNNLLIGKPSWTSSSDLSYNGVLDDIRIYNRGLDSCDVDSLFNMPNPAILSVNEQKTNAGIWVFPNPASDNICVQVPAGNGSVKAGLINSMGQTVKTEAILPVGENVFKMELSGLPNGIYFLQIGNSIQKIQILK